MSSIPDLATIVRHGMCAGCGACESIAGHDRVKMALNADGWLRPAIAEEPDEQAMDLIRKVCPGVVVSANEPERVGRDTYISRRWGPIASLHRVHATDETVRFHAAAGGALSAMSLYLLESGTVDFIAHVRTSPDHPMRTVSHVSRTREEVLLGAQSRYEPGAPLDHVMELLDRGERFAFVGKPCDVAALRNLAREDKRVDRLVPYMLTLFCGGLPKVDMALDMVRHHGVDPDSVTLFRYRGEGWPGPTHIEDRNGGVHEHSYAFAYMDPSTAFRYDMQFRCKLCSDAIGEVADVACPDAWETVDGEPVHEEAPGWNLAVARTKAGAELVRNAAEAGYLTLTPYTEAELDHLHRDHKPRRMTNLPRSLGTRLAGEPVTRWRGMRQVRLMVDFGLGRSWRAFLGAFRRARQGRNRESLAPPEAVAGGRSG